MKRVHAVLPEGFDDPERPSGGNFYDARIIAGLSSIGWTVAVHEVAGSWPAPGPSAVVRLHRLLAGLADDAVVLVDGLIASAVPDLLGPAGSRVQVVVLLHLPLGGPVGGPVGNRNSGASDREGRVLSSAAAVITTSEWTRARVLELYEVPPERVRVAVPGVCRALPVAGTPGGGQLLCVAALIPSKGHDLLIAALGKLTDLEWNLLCVGRRGLDPAYVTGLVALAEELGIGKRVRFVGTQTRERLAASYAAADVVVLATRMESYGMVLTEALARGLPVIATSVGGVSEAVGRSPADRRPGLLVPSEDAGALAGAVRRWLERPVLRATLRRNALERRGSLTGWDETTARVDRVLAEVRA